MTKRRRFSIALIGFVTIASIAPAVAERHGVYPVQTLRDKCVKFSDIKTRDNAGIADCSVSDFGEFGTVGEEKYYFALYCLIPSHIQGKCNDGSFHARYYRNRGLSVFVQQGPARNAKLLFEAPTPETELFAFERPEMVRNEIGTFLIMPARLDGTSNGNGSRYYLWQAQTWKPLDAKTWLEDLKKRLPAGFQVLKGVWPDLRTMKAKAGLWRSGDSNCCPTGGEAHITLTVDGAKFVLQSLKTDVLPKP